MKVLKVVLMVSAVCALVWGCSTGYSSRGVELMKEGKLSQAYEAFEKEYQANPDSPFALNNMGYVYEMKYRDYRKAAELYQKALEKLSPDDVVTTSSNQDAVGKNLQKIVGENLGRVMLKIRNRGSQT